MEVVADQAENISATVNSTAWVGYEHYLCQENSAQAVTVYALAVLLLSSGAGEKI